MNSKRHGKTGRLEASEFVEIWAFYQSVIHYFQHMIQEMATYLKAEIRIQ